MLAIRVEKVARHLERGVREISAPREATIRVCGRGYKAVLTPDIRRIKTPRRRRPDAPSGTSGLYELERETGFEPATLSLGDGPAGGSGVRSGSQWLVSTGGAASGGVQRSQPDRPVLGDSATPLLPSSPTIRSDALLTVREAARFLRVSTATVYKLCARGELAHVRVLNVIRIPAKVVESGALES